MTENEGKPLSPRKHHSTKAMSAMDQSEVGCTTHPCNLTVKLMVHRYANNLRCTTCTSHCLSHPYAPTSPFRATPRPSSAPTAARRSPAPDSRSPLARLGTTSTVPRSTAAGPLRRLHRGLGALPAAAGLQLGSRNRQLQLQYRMHHQVIYQHLLAALLNEIAS